MRDFAKTGCISDSNADEKGMYLSTGKKPELMLLKFMSSTY